MYVCVYIWVDNYNSPYIRVFSMFYFDDRRMIYQSTSLRRRHINMCTNISYELKVGRELAGDSEN